MESPFHNAKKTTVMYLEPILNSYYKTYQNVITFNHIPSGPIREMVTTIRVPQLSTFQSFSPFYGNGGGGGVENCLPVLMRYPIGYNGVASGYNGVASGYSAFIKNTDAAMGADDIPSVLSYLLENGYSVDTKMTRMLQSSEINIGGPAMNRPSGKRKMICFFTYNL
jgi:hypothetical protein